MKTILSLFLALLTAPALAVDATNPAILGAHKGQLMIQAGLTMPPVLVPETPAYVMARRIARKEAAGIAVSDAEYLALFNACKAR